jgi:hypothetical protein
VKHLLNVLRGPCSLAQFFYEKLMHSLRNLNVTERALACLLKENVQALAVALGLLLLASCGQEPPAAEKVAGAEKKEAAPATEPPKAAAAANADADAAGREAQKEAERINAEQEALRKATK